MLSLYDLVIEKIGNRDMLWRYIFYRNMDVSRAAADEDLIFIASHDYLRQIELLEQGYYGVQLGKVDGEIGMLFRK